VVRTLFTLLVEYIYLFQNCFPSHQCGIQFQISDELSREVRTEAIGETSDGDLHLIRHIHIKNVPLDFNRAMRCLNKIKAHDPNIYKQFLDIMQAHRKIDVGELPFILWCDLNTLYSDSSIRANRAVI